MGFCRGLGASLGELQGPKVEQFKCVLKTTAILCWMSSRHILPPIVLATCSLASISFAIQKFSVSRDPICWSYFPCYWSLQKALTCACTLKRTPYFFLPSTSRHELVPGGLVKHSKHMHLHTDIHRPLTGWVSSVGTFP